MNRNLIVNLTKEEYSEYLIDQLNRSNVMKGYRWFLIISVPSVLISLIFFFKMSYAPIIMSFIAIIIIWIFYLWKTVWSRFIRGKVNHQFISKLNVENIKEVRYHFNEDNISYNEPKKTSVSFKDVVALVELNHQFVIYTTKGPLLIPYKSFASEDDIKNFAVEFEKAWKVKRYAS